MRGQESSRIGSKSSQIKPNRMEIKPNLIKIISNRIESKSNRNPYKIKSKSKQNQIEIQPNQNQSQIEVLGKSWGNPRNSYNKSQGNHIESLQVIGPQEFLVPTSVAGGSWSLTSLGRGQGSWPAPLGTTEVLGFLISQDFFDSLRISKDFN